MAKRMVQTIVGTEACLVALCMRSPTAFFSLKSRICFCSSCSNFSSPFLQQTESTMHQNNNKNNNSRHNSSPQVSPASPLSFSYGSRICYVATSERVALSDELRQLYAVRDRIVRDVLTCVFIFLHGDGTCCATVSSALPARIARHTCPFLIGSHALV